MSNLDTFTRDALAGGYNPDKDPQFKMARANIVLSPSAWQAVGKTCLKEWGEFTFWSYTETEPTWRNKWRRFINALADGKTIDDALGSI